MKVSELYIKKYHQFENFTLNLTYPEGHKLAGQPLNKVCFIGQSGTGKTTLLEILKELILMSYVRRDSVSEKGYGEGYLVGQDNLGREIGLDFNSEQQTESSFFYNFKSQSKENAEPFHFKKHKSSKLFNYPSDIFLPKQNKAFKETSLDNDYKLKDALFIDFENYDINKIWQTINEIIFEDRTLEFKKTLEISKILRNPKVSKDILDKAIDSFRKWREETPNPIQDLADNYLDKIIGRFNLKVKTELDEDIETIKIQQKNGKEIPFGALSTGTKQVILTALPLYGLKPKESIILFDEPERSLYPDIQTEIVDFYTSMAENSQFFFATHSPLVAASFEPWEIVELKFNEETGNVEQEFYYEKEKGRHVDNYTIYPQYLTYDGILKRVFDIKKEPNDLRTGELVKLATLESQLKHNNLSPEAKKEKFEEYKKLADQLDWDLK